MLRVAVGTSVLLAACAATPSDDVTHDSFVRNPNCMGGGAAGRASLDVAWQAACRAMAWGGGEIRVDASARRVGRNDSMEVVVYSYRGRARYSLLADTTNEETFAPQTFDRRFQQALCLMESGRPVPLQAPPLDWDPLLGREYIQSDFQDWIE